MVVCSAGHVFCYGLVIFLFHAPVGYDSISDKVITLTLFVTGAAVRSTPLAAFSGGGQMQLPALSLLASRQPGLHADLDVPDWLKPKKSS
jgi:hypothetical protein